MDCSLAFKLRRLLTAQPKTRIQENSKAVFWQAGKTLLILLFFVWGCGTAAPILLGDPKTGKVVNCADEDCAQQMEAAGYRRLSPEERDRILRSQKGQPK